MLPTEQRFKDLTLEQLVWLQTMEVGPKKQSTPYNYDRDNTVSNAFSEAQIETSNNTPAVDVFEALEKDQEIDNWDDISEAVLKKFKLVEDKNEILAG